VVASKVDAVQIEDDLKPAQPAMCSCQPVGIPRGHLKVADEHLVSAQCVTPSATVSSGVITLPLLFDIFSFPSGARIMPWFRSL
jgi:hypothetical protein